MSQIWLVLENLGEVKKKKTANGLSVNSIPTVERLKCDKLGIQVGEASSRYSKRPNLKKCAAYELAPDKVAFPEW